jgi:small subunit ribosomal protein S6
MRDYEVVYIFNSTLTTEEIEARLESYNERILGTEGSEITAVEHWGKRQLAYPIDRNDNGYYVVTQFTAPPSVLPEFERALKLDDDLLRHLVVLSEGELTTPIPLGESAKLEDSDDADEVRGSDRKRTKSYAEDVEEDDEFDEDEEDEDDEDEEDEDEEDEG